MTLVERAAAGVRVTVVSAHPAVRERFAAADVPVVAPAEGTPTDFTGRMLLADGRNVLLSADAEESGEETALWSSDTPMAEVLIRILSGGVDAIVGG